MSRVTLSEVTIALPPHQVVITADQAEALDLLYEEPPFLNDWGVQIDDHDRTLDFVLHKIAVSQNQSHPAHVILTPVRGARRIGTGIMSVGSGRILVTGIGALEMLP